MKITPASTKQLPLPLDPQDGNGKADFNRQSVLYGRDYQAIELLLGLHMPNPNPVILDCTFSKGTMWKKCAYQPTFKTDIRVLPKITLAADAAALPFTAASMDVIVYDPPHLPNAAGSQHSSKMWWDRYGLTDQGREGDNVSSLFLPFLLSAKRVLKPGGIILCKLADLVHNHRYQWQQVEFIMACWQAGITPCDMLIKCDPNAGNLKSSLWVNQKHLRKAHCYWIVVRNSPKCES